MNKIMLLAGAAALLATPAFADLAGELSTAQTHAGMASTQADIMMAHKHLQHAVNCLVGPSGDGFDAAAGNPCGKAGMGAIPDSTDAAQKAKLTSIAMTAKAGVANTDLMASQKVAKDTADAIAAASK
ncbi:MAG: hypothetical protein JWP16_286 [Alphaproteobacteria bacterium]|nr:hypothetical protein [Alphaproteobacteria bacterium]MDB5739246.1 hypothetical protein [Alphaproteobacteria bacterium]